MNTKDDLTPDVIVKYLKVFEGVIQRTLYPNPGEPQLNEKILYDPNRWVAECMQHVESCSDCFPLRDGVTDGCGNPDECYAWVFYPNYGAAKGEDIDEWPSELTCYVVDDHITFSAD